MLGAAGLAMIVPLFAPSQWRARRAPLPEVAEPGEFFSGLTAAIASQAPEEPDSDSQAYQPGWLPPRRAFTMADHWWVWWA